MNWNDLEENVYRAAKTAFLDLQDAHPDEHFYAFALYTDSGAMTICPAANSHEALARKLAKEEIDPADEDVPYYTWSSSEWSYESWQADPFNDICTTLRNALDTDRDFDHFQTQVFKTMTNALARLGQEGVFREHGSASGPVLFVTLTDDDQAEAVENTSAEALNGEDVFARFAARYDGVQQ